MLNQIEIKKREDENIAYENSFILPKMSRNADVAFDRKKGQSLKTTNDRNKIDMTRKQQPQLVID